MLAYKYFLTILIGLFVFSGCVTAPKEDVSENELTYSKVKQGIIKGKTTQEEIIKLFGSPNIITKNKSNNETWMYNRISYETSSEDAWATILFLGRASAVSTSTTKSFDLMIEFDQSDTVVDYSAVVSKY